MVNGEFSDVSHDIFESEPLEWSTRVGALLWKFEFTLEYAMKEYALECVLFKFYCIRNPSLGLWDSIWPDIRHLSGARE